MRLSIILLAGLASLAGCSSTNINALAEDEVAIGIRDLLFFCTLKAETDPNASCTDGAGAYVIAGIESERPESGDICVNDGDEITFKSFRRRNNQFLIVPMGKNPFQDPEVPNAGCRVLSTDGTLRCRIKAPDPLAVGEFKTYKYSLFGEGCSQSLDPRVFVIRGS